METRNSHSIYLQLKDMKSDELIEVLDNSESKEEEYFWFNCYNYFLKENQKIQLKKEGISCDW